MAEVIVHREYPLETGQIGLPPEREDMSVLRSSARKTSSKLSSATDSPSRKLPASWKVKEEHILPKRIAFVQGGYYHIYNRGAGRQRIFVEERNYVYLLRLLKKVAAECDVMVVAYCLLPNHYHWLLRQDGENAAGKVPTRAFGSYTQAFNRAYERTGTLFEGPYKALPVDSDAYFVNLCSYIHLNAVHHGLVETPDAWPYSNYLEWIDKRPGKLIDRDLVRQYFASPQAYEDCVRDLQQRYTFQEAASFLEGRETLHNDCL
jgi:putative transposase